MIKIRTRKDYLVNLRTYLYFVQLFLLSFCSILNRFQSLKCVKALRLSPKHRIGIHSSSRAKLFSINRHDDITPSTKFDTCSTIINSNLSQRSNMCTQNVPRRNALLLPIHSLMLLSTIQNNKPAYAAPPIAIIAEELGYFPVTNKSGETAYVPARVKRQSTEQAIALSLYLKDIGATMYGAYWCPHCQNQREIFGREAWSNVLYVECSVRGYGYDPTKIPKDVNGFPTWKLANNTTNNFKNKKGNIMSISGEMPLELIAKKSGYNGDIDVTLEPSMPQMMTGSCQ
mmetsp:Transcript_10456/g.14777  ORF Transcript_10456/g.14777 Transcript_10456/m.14777 type:complete len:286 (-) Transcript_10456:110-967(-)